MFNIIRNFKFPQIHVEIIISNLSASIYRRCATNIDGLSAQFRRIVDEIFCLRNGTFFILPSITRIISVNPLSFQTQRSNETENTNNLNWSKRIRWNQIQKWMKYSHPINNWQHKRKRAHLYVHLLPDYCIGIKKTRTLQCKNKLSDQRFPVRTVWNI